MRILIRSAEIIDPLSPHHRTRKNILIENSRITSISNKTEKADKVIEGGNLHISPGWFDMRAWMGDPGIEHKEDINSFKLAASAGGFTGVACLPNTSPVIQTKDVISYIKQKASHLPVEIFPIAAITIGTKGEELSEMLDLHEAGAVAFSDGENPVWHTDVLLKALQYVSKFNGLLVNVPDDKLLSAYGQMNEGLVSTMLGLKGIPNLAEEVMVQRDLKVLEYTGGKLHFSLISTPGSLQLIKEAKKKGLNVTCDIAYYHLALEDKEIESFDTSYKVKPPLRTKREIDIFKKALKDNIIDLVVSNHRPQDQESKNLEFDLADFGMTGLESVYSLLNMTLPGESQDFIVEKIALAPRRVLNLLVPSIKEGEQANVTVFDPDKEWIFSHSKSKSVNSPFLGKNMKGRAIAVINNGNFYVND